MINKEINSFRDLIVWKKSVLMVKNIFLITTNFPDSELWGLTNQIRRSAVSIPSNIAEGYGRRSKLDYIRFLKISRGSLYELISQIEISKELDFINKETYITIINDTTEIDKMLNSLIKRIE